MGPAILRRKKKKLLNRNNFPKFSRKNCSTGGGRGPGREKAAAGETGGVGGGQCPPNLSDSLFEIIEKINPSSFFSKENYYEMPPNKITKSPREPTVLAYKKLERCAAAMICFLSCKFSKCKIINGNNIFFIF